MDQTIVKTSSFRPRTSRRANRSAGASLRLRLWNTIPQGIRLALGYLYDFFRYWRYAGVFTAKQKNKLAASAHLTMEYHRIEKGLALRETRLNFGEENVSSLTMELSEYVKNYGFDQTAACCWKALDDYHAFHRGFGAVNQELVSQWEQIDLSPEQKASAGKFRATAPITREDILIAAKIDFENFAFSRFSVRDFSEKEVDIELIREAARIAQKTPSVCNRQAWRLHIYQETEIKNRVLRYQSGNRGFASAIKIVLIVTVEVEHFFSPGERNQGFIDGGLYGMSLVYALHSLGLASCCLNLANELPSEMGLRRASGIKSNEAFIMMIAVGHYPDKLNVAASQRKKHLDVIRVHE